jgi:hypothetical protein
METIAAGVEYINTRRVDLRLLPLVERVGKKEASLIWVNIVQWLYALAMTKRIYSDLKVTMSCRLNLEWMWCQQLKTYVETDSELSTLFEVRDNCLCYREDLPEEKQEQIEEYVYTHLEVKPMA